MGDSEAAWSNFSLAPENEPLVSIVIPTHLRAPKLAATLAAIHAQDYENAEVVVVATPDADTERILRTPLCDELDATVVVQETSGVSEARNIALEYATGDIVAFTDDDCVPPPDWVSGIVAVFDAYDVVTTGGMQLPHERVYNRFPARVDESRILRNQLPHRRDRDDNGVAVGGMELRTFATSNVAYRRTAIEETSASFDETLHRGEDATFQRTVLEAYPEGNAFLPIPVWHNRDYTLRQFLDQRYRNGIAESGTPDGRSFMGSIAGIALAPLLLARSIHREDSLSTAICAWIGDVTARIGVGVGTLRN
nr:glycosyltransferase family 2 protein [Halorubellus sp. JP-L1]